MSRKLLSIIATIPFLFGCVASEPRPQLQTEGKEVVTVFTEPHEFMMRGLRGAQTSPPTIQTVKFKLQCLKNFDGRSVQTRANASAQYANIYQQTSEGQLMINRIVFGWIRQIEDHSIAEQGCEVYPQVSGKTVIFDLVSDSPSAVMSYALRHNLL